MLFLKTIRYSEHGFPDPSRDRIMLIGCYSKRFKVFEGDEKKLLAEFIEFFRKEDPDMIITYKGDYDDWPFIIERCKKHGLKLEIGKQGEEPKLTGKYFRGIILRETVIPGRQNIDLFPVAWRDFPRLPTKEIDEFAEALGIKPIKLIPEHKIHEKSIDELKEYLKQYLSLLRDIAEKILPFEEELAKLVGLPLDRQIRHTVGELVDVIVTREMKKRNIKPIKTRKRMRYIGGLVWLKAPGIYHDVAYLDFQSMYPSIIKAWNISPETVGNEGEEVEVEGVKHKVRRDVKGVIPSLIEKFLETRREIKRKMKKAKGAEFLRLDAQQRAIKVVTNAMYGYMGWDGATYYNVAAAELTAALARYYIKEVRKILESKGCDVIYIDTDGIQFIGKDLDAIVEEINSKLPLTIEIERVAKTAIFWAKKKYAHLFDGKMEVKGLEMIRKDYPRFIRKVQAEVIKALLEGKVTDAREIAKRYKEKLIRKEVPIEELAIVEQMTKKPEEYEKATKASVVAKLLQEKFGVELHRGTNLHIIIVKGSGGPTFRARPLEFVDAKEVDWGYYVKQYEDVMERTLSVAKPTLTAFFGK